MTLGVNCEKYHQHSTSCLKVHSHLRFGYITKKDIPSSWVLGNCTCNRKKTVQTPTGTVKKCCPCVTTIVTVHRSGFPLFRTDKIPWYFHDFSRFFLVNFQVFFIIFIVWFLVVSNINLQTYQVSFEPKIAHFQLYSSWNFFFEK